MKRTPLLVGALLSLSLAACHAQLRLPGVGRLPEIIRPPNPDLPPLRQRLESSLAPLDLQGQRQRLGDALLARHPRELMREPGGALIVREQLLAQPSDSAARERLLALPGIALIEDAVLEGLGLSWLLLRADPALLPRLRALDPDGLYDYQHLYLGSGGGGSGESSPASAVHRASPADKTGPRVGLIDSGVDSRHPALQAADIRPYGCGTEAHPGAHGTAVASLLVGREGAFRGAVPDATLLAVDAYCDAADGGSAQRIAQGLAWLAREQAGVVNISLVGPPNALLQRVVAAAQARGLLIVAAVGNDGPAAPPLYPAAWPGVVAVTAVDARRRVLAEAGRGAHVRLAAPGSEMVGAGDDGAYVELRGTSFAAPLVAGLLAMQLAQAGTAGAELALGRLRSDALDLGTGGRDDIFGWGLVGEALRTRKPR